MSKMTLAASLVSAGLATLITAAVVERQMMKELDERVERELEASVEYLVETKQAEPTEEYLEKEEAKRVGTKVALAKPSLDEVMENSQRVRYDLINKREEYSPEDDEAQEPSEPEYEIFAITTAEFMDNESGYLQSSLTFYADGGVLDEENELVIAHQDMIGDATPPFGQLSGEPHIVYLRNTRIQREFEVIRDDAAAADILADPSDVT